METGLIYCAATVYLLLLALFVRCESVLTLVPVIVVDFQTCEVQSQYMNIMQSDKCRHKAASSGASRGIESDGALSAAYIEGKLGIIQHKENPKPSEQVLPPVYPSAARPRGVAADGETREEEGERRSQAAPEYAFAQFPALIFQCTVTLRPNGTRQACRQVKCPKLLRQLEANAKLALELNSK